MGSVGMENMPEIFFAWITIVVQNLEWITHNMEDIMNRAWIIVHDGFPGMVVEAYMDLGWA